MFKGFIAILLLIVVIATGCNETSTQDLEPTTSSKTPVTFHHYFSGTLSGGIDDMVAIYNNASNDYVINVVPIDHEAYKVNIVANFANGTPADLNTNWAGARTHSLIDSLENLDDLFVDKTLKEGFSPTMLNSASMYDGHYYLMPITQHYVTFFYNKKVFERYNLKEPVNWPEFLVVCDKLKSEGITPIGLGAKNRWPAQFWFDYLLLRTSGAEYRNLLMSGYASYTDPEVKQALFLWTDLIDKGYFNDNCTSAEWDIDIIEGLKNGQYAMTLNGTWLFSLLEDPTENYGVFSFPIIDASTPTVALGPVDGIVIGHDSLNITGAKEVLKAFAGTDIQKTMAIGSGGFAPNLNVDQSIYSPLHLELLEDINNSSEWAFNYDLATDPRRAELGLTFFTEFLVFPESYELLLDELENNMGR